MAERRTGACPVERSWQIPSFVPMMAETMALVARGDKTFRNREVQDPDRRSVARPIAAPCLVARLCRA
jgi:hypothetical protein